MSPETHTKLFIRELCGSAVILFTNGYIADKARRALHNLAQPAAGQGLIRYKVQHALPHRFTKNDLTILNNNIFRGIARRI